MPEYIERKEALKELNKNSITKKITLADGVSIYDTIKQLPFADVVEVKHGEWKSCFEDWRKQIEGDECSVCGFQHYGTSISLYHYCPNCGAKMDGGNNDN